MLITPNRLDRQAAIAGGRRGRAAIWDPCRIDQANGNEIAKMSPAFVSNRIQFHSHRRYHGQHIKVFSVLNFSEHRPMEYVAAPRVHLGSQAEIDIAAYDRGDRRADYSSSVGDLATAVWAPAKPTFEFETELAVSLTGTFSRLPVR